jgi:hypothetical protein
MDGGGEVGAEIDQLCITRVCAVPIGAQVNPFRLAGEAAFQSLRQWRLRSPFEIAILLAVPGELAAGQFDEESVRALVFKPICYLLGDPWRDYGLGRAQQNKIAGLREHKTQWLCWQSAANGSPQGEFPDNRENTGNLIEIGPTRTLNTSIQQGLAVEFPRGWNRKSLDANSELSPK